jgi:hypothetical protein
VAQDYDAPRGTDDGSETVPLDGLDPARDGARTAVMELDEPDLVDGFDLPGEDLSGLELTVEIIPVQADEFTCSSCFLVRHRTQKTREKDGQAYCVDCEG